MTTSFTVKISLALLAICSAQAVGFSTQTAWAKPVPPITVQPNTPQTTFHCTPGQGGSYATIAKRGDRQTPPMIIWTSTLGEYGQYTPQRRCEIVSDKFTQAVVLNGGKLKSMLLTYGFNNRQRVICYVNRPNGSCTSDNQLFTLRPTDYGRERQILERLVNFGVHGSGTPVQQSGELFYANVGESIDRFFSDSNNTQEPANTPTSSPVSIPKSPDIPANPINKESSI
jgi:Circadian oscillating protein COP23